MLQHCQDTTIAANKKNACLVVLPFATLSTTTTCTTAAGALLPNNNETRQEKSEKITTKANTILNWLKSATAQAVSPTTIAKTKKTTAESIILDLPHNRNDSPSTKGASEWSFGRPTVVEATATTSKRDQKTPTDVALRDFRGVQDLRHLWNKRISAQEESRWSGNSRDSKFTKSISCLVQAATGADVVVGGGQTKTETGKNQHFGVKRTQSLHDCTHFGDVLELGARTDERQRAALLHREKDNFYKYKTAEQAAKHVAREAAKTKKRFTFSAPTSERGAHFFNSKSCIKNEHTHRVQRQDMVTSTVVSTTPTSDIGVCDWLLLDAAEASANISSVMTSGLSACNGACNVSDDVIKSKASSADVTLCQGQTNPHITKTMSNMKNSASDCGIVVSATSIALRETKRKIGNTESSNSVAQVTLRNSGGGGGCGPIVATTRRSASVATRKCSFKTHTRFYHTPRRMNTKDTNGGSNASMGGAGTGNNFSMVAKLTQQFNEIIQKDRKLLDEVKRKNGVLMSRGGHIYKVVQRPIDSQCKGPLKSATESPRTSMVQRNIKKFEGAKIGDGSKPKVPAKSPHLLRKRNELVCAKRQAMAGNISGYTAAVSNAKRLHLSQTQSNADTVLLPVDGKGANILLHTDVSGGLALKAQLPETELYVPNYKTAGSTLVGNMLPLTVDDAVEVLAEVGSEPLKTTNSATEACHEAPTILENAAEVAQVPCAPLIPTATATTAANRAVTPIDKPLNTESIHSAIDCMENHVDATRVEIGKEDLVNADKMKSRQKYVKIYEKLGLRSPFKTASSKKTKPKSSPEKMGEKVHISPQQEISYSDIAEAEPEARLLDALQVIDRKLKGLSGCATPPITTPAPLLLLRKSDDFVQCVVPNSSFVYQTCVKKVCSNQLIVTQAVNVALVNNIEGEQMIMEQKELLRRLKAAENEATLNENTLKAGNSDMSPLHDATIDTPITMQDEKTYQSIYPAEEESKETKTETDLQYQTSFIFKQQQSSKTNESSSEYDNYQTLVDAEQQTSQLQSMSVARSNSLNYYELIAGSCEQVVPILPIMLPTYFDGYEICALPIQKPTITPAISQTPNGTLMGRNTTDKLPELPNPKAKLRRSPMTGKRIPHKSPLQQQLAVPAPSASLLLDDEHHYYADDENIYDTIKGSHCYEAVHNESIKFSSGDGSVFGCKTADSDSLTSNGYESISQYRRLALHHNQRRNATASSSNGSTLTISSDQKTNSLYEMSLAAGQPYGGAGVSASQSTSGGGSSATANSESGSRGDSDVCELKATGINAPSHITLSDNSDEWIDISDTEGNQAVNKQQFIVVRERKLHRSPDWSKRVRQKRLQQEKIMSCIEDDSDHYYESLSPVSNKRHFSQLVQHNYSHHKRNKDLPTIQLSQSSKKCSPLTYASGKPLGVESDSFDSDTDEIYEEHMNIMKNHNDSGVDMRHMKLPEPPSSTNQVYAIVRKFKNFISSKKSQTLKHGSSQQRIYENGSQFYVEANVYENSPSTAGKVSQSHRRNATSQQTLGSGTDEIYENTEFHKPTPIKTGAKQLSTSDKNLSQHGSKLEPLYNGTSDNKAATLRSKTKATKSFKSRLRKSLGGSTMDSKHLSSLTTPTRSTFYLEDPSNNGCGELDSGFSEKPFPSDLLLTNVDASPYPTRDALHPTTATRKMKTADSKSLSSQYRRTITGIRPHDPPPPPPEETSSANMRLMLPQPNADDSVNTSWYAECGVFKHGNTCNATYNQSQGSGNNVNYSQHGSSSTHTNGNSWYAEAGLYQTSGTSVASSSGSSGVSTGNEGGLNDDQPHSMFLNEPLYQIYSAAKLESISRDMEEHDGASTDGYEEVGQHRNSGDCHERRSKRRTALQMIGQENGPARTLWSEIPEVINSYILPTLTARERSLQEAKFEIITSEASYLKSLNLLRTHFMNHPIFRDISVVSGRDRKALFSYIVPVHECSERLLTELESCWQDSIMLLHLAKCIYIIAEKYFQVYIAFCEHQGRMDRTLRRLKETKGVFAQNLNLLESSPTCCGLNLHSFLMLPMQRITRLPLLVDAVFSKVSPNDEEYDSWKMTLAIMNKVVTQCNDAANRCEQAYEIERISRQLEFPTCIRALAIAPVGVPVAGSKPRFLVKKGELIHLIWRGDDSKLTFGKKFIKTTVYAFLFSDLLVLTKRKGESLFSVFDYCPRNMLTISSGDTLPQLPTKDMSQTGKNLILMTLLENHERKTIELVLACTSISEQERWLQAMRPPESETPGEKLYEQWDCPQVIAKHSYDVKEPDALNLEVGDVINVTRKLLDGWYHGERIRDGVSGWFPGSYTEEVNSAHVRARNLKQRYRLLTFTATYLETQKRK